MKRMMTSGGGSIALCSSAVARHGIPNHEAIAAAKAGLQGGCGDGCRRTASTTKLTVT